MRCGCVDLIRLGFSCVWFYVFWCGFTVMMFGVFSFGPHRFLQLSTAVFMGVLVPWCFKAYSVFSVLHLIPARSPPPLNMLHTLNQAVRVLYTMASVTMAQT